MCVLGKEEKRREEQRVDAQLDSSLSRVCGVVLCCVVFQIEGRWELAFATSPSTASPIQRTAFGSSGTRVYQARRDGGDGDGTFLSLSLCK